MFENFEVVQVAIKDLIPADYNPRRLSKKQFEDIQKSILEFGFVQPIVVNCRPERMNVVIGGHQRIKVAAKLGYETLPVIYVNLTIEKEQELNIRLNKNAGEWDFEALANYFDVPELVEWGFDRDELAIFDASPEEVDEPSTDSLSVKVTCSDVGQRQSLIAELKERGFTVK